jgi:hypothetical protein
MSMEYTRRALGWDDPDDEAQQRALEYQIYQEAFQVALSDSLVSAARSCSHEIHVRLFSELLSAKQAVEEAARIEAGPRVGRFDPLLLSWFRAYRAIEWYESELADAIANAITDPFSQYLKPGTTIKAWEFFRADVLAGLRRAVLNAMFDPAPFVSTVENFYSQHRQKRHSIVHGIYQPELPESKACVTDAIAIYTLVDDKLNSMHTTALDAPDFS